MSTLRPSFLGCHTAMSCDSCTVASLCVVAAATWQVESNYAMLYYTGSSSIPWKGRSSINAHNTRLEDIKHANPTSAQILKIQQPQICRNLVNPILCFSCISPCIMHTYLRILCTHVHSCQTSFHEISEVGEMEMQAQHNSTHRHTHT